VPNFKPDRSLRSRLGLDEDKVIVTLRPPATEAHYHNPQSDELFKAAVEFLSQSPGVKVILLPRNAKQGTLARQCWPNLFAAGKIVIPEHAVDGLNLVWHSDLVISGGGTMNREAAAMGVPVYSIFRGKIGAVDKYLANQGRLVLLESVDDVRTKIILSRRHRTVASQNGKRASLNTIVDSAVSILESQRQYAMSK
jgi:predicted glycosyltransferase